LKDIGAKFSNDDTQRFFLDNLIIAFDRESTLDVITYNNDNISANITVS
jgi:hypothetical protein